VHLAGVGVRELVELQIDDDEAAQAPVEEQQVDPVPRVADAQPALATDEREVAAELEEKCLQLGDSARLRGRSPCASGACAIGRRARARVD
jgi:hypothetical protein